MAKNNYLVRKKDMLQVLRQIVIDYPFIPCKQLNSFAMIEDGEHHAADTFPATYQSYLDGFFWSRDWYANGANENTMQLEYPALFVEQIPSSRPNINKKNNCFKFYLLIVDIPDCEACPSECKRSKTQVLCDVEEMINDLLDELILYQLYESKKDGETFHVWATPEKTNVMIQDGVFDTMVETGIEIFTYIKNTEVQMNPWRSGKFSTAENLVGVAVALEFCGCFSEKKEFNYKSVNPKLLASTKCSDCK